MLFFLSIRLLGQFPYHYNLNEESGLPSSEVYQIRQDHFGYIWLGTDAGLFRYDGVWFKQFSYSKENGRSISGLHVDTKGNLWCQNFAGQIFRVEKDSLVLFKDFSNDMRVFPQFTVDHEGSVWISSEKYIKKFDSKGNLIIKISELNDNKDTVSWSDIEVDSKGQVFATAYNKGLCQIESRGKTYSLKWIQKNIQLVGRSLFDIVGDKVFLITENELGKKYIISELLKSGELKSFEPINLGLFVYTINADSDGVLWVGTSDGIYPINNKLNRIDLSKAMFLNDKISNFYQDKESNIWISSLQNGIHVIPNQKLFLYDKENSALHDNYISSLSVNKFGELLIGTYSGIVYKLNKSNTLERLHHTEGVNYRSVKKILPYKNGYLISRGPFSFVNSTSEKIFYMKNARDFCVLNDTIYFTSSHTTGYVAGLDKIIDGNDSYDENFITILSKSGRSIVEDGKGNKIFFAANDGVYEYSGQILKPLLYRGERINASMLEFANDRLWISTINQGFLSYKNGLMQAENKINSLVKGNRIKTFKILLQTIWVATEECLNKIDLVTKNHQCYNLTDGLLTKEINSIMFLDSSTYLATNKGLIQLPFHASSINLTRPEIKITDVIVNDSVIHLFKELDLNYDQNKLQIKFSSSCLRARGDFGYKYRLIGLDTSWTFLTAINNTIIFPSLPSGSFTFQVKAVNEDGVESNYADEIQLKIGKPFWETWWFYILIALGSALLVLFVALLIIRNIKRKAKAKNELVTSQLTAIRAQMNPHFMYNTLNSIQDLILKNEIKNTNYYLSKFSTLMRKILEFSEAEKILLEEEIEMLQNYLELEKLRFGNDFTFTFYIADDADVHRTMIPSLIIQPFVENAIKHGLLHKKGPKELYIAFNKVKDDIVVSIEDNGIGRKRSEEIKQRSQLQHKSFAVGATQKRLDLLNQEREHKIRLEIIDKYEKEVIAAGTLVKIYFPVI